MHMPGSLGMHTGLERSSGGCYGRVYPQICSSGCKFFYLLGSHQDIQVAFGERQENVHNLFLGPDLFEILLHRSPFDL